jgi:predicted anti-sigma-YlaC factor YlaD
MTCHELDERLDEWVDGELPAAAATEVEAHLASCPLCRGREQRLRQLLAHAAALPRSVAPERDLWPAIARRVERERAWSWRSVGWSPVVLAAAATVAIGLAAVFWSGQSPAARVRTVEIPTPTPEARRVAGTDGLSDPVLAAAARDYEAAAHVLLEALQQRRARLQPEDLAAVEANLDVIDRALAEVRQALVRSPENAELGRMLVSTHRKKVEVLSRVVKLSTAL